MRSRFNASWALGLIDALPPYDTKPDVEKILALIPYLTAEEWGLIRSITMERHFALNWLCVYAPNNEWDDTPTPT